MSEEKEPIDEEGLKAVLSSYYSAASSYIDTTIAPERIKAMEYYHGKTFGNEVENRSQIVMTEVRDTILAMMPSLLRIFTSAERPVEFIPNSEATVDLAEQQTDYINHIILQDNDGFMIFYNTIKDALRSKTGIFKWWREQSKTVSEYEFTRLTEEQMAMLAQQKGVEVIKAEHYLDPDWHVPPPPSPPMLQQPLMLGQGAPQSAVPPQPYTPPPAPVLYDVKIRKTATDPRQFRVAAVPPEELIWDSRARNIRHADYAAHRQLQSIQDLKALGYDEEVLEDNIATNLRFGINSEAQARAPEDTMYLNNTFMTNEDARKVLYVEHYVRIDQDGDGIAEIRKVCTIGEDGGFVILNNEIVDEIPFSIICPDPEPHKIVGESIADQVMDLQLLKSNIMRGTLDSLTQSLFPRTVVVEHNVNLDDVLNQEMGAVIRERVAGSVRTLETPWLGQQTLPMMDYLDATRSSRTGVTKASQGLDAEVLQSTTKTAVSATISAAQERIEMVARIFAETGIKDMFKGLLRLVTRYQDQTRMVKLRGKWVEINPASWDCELDVLVNVGLGQGSVQERMQGLQFILAKQEQAITAGGAQNPLANLAHYRAGLASMCELMNIKDASKYFAQLGQAEAQQMAQQAAEAPKPEDPSVLLVKIEQNKIQLKAQSDAAKLHQDGVLATQRLQQESVITAERLKLEREQIELNAQLKIMEIESRYKTQIEATTLQTDAQKLQTLATKDIADKQHGLNEATALQNHSQTHKNMISELLEGVSEVFNAKPHA